MIKLVVLIADCVRPRASSITQAGSQSA